MGPRMGITMSVILSFVGNLTSGHFTLRGFITSFILSAMISIIIGFVVPVGKVSGDVSHSMGLVRGTLPARLIESLVANTIYTPIMTFVMVYMAYATAMRMSGGKAGLHFGQMFLHSLIICFLIGYVLCFILQPIFLKSLCKKYDVPYPPEPAMAAQAAAKAKEEAKANEAENNEGKLFGNERLLDLLRKTDFENARQVIETMTAEVDQYRNGAEPNDDLTMMVIHCK